MDEAMGLCRRSLASRERRRAKMRVLDEAYEMAHQVVIHPCRKVGIFLEVGLCDVTRGRSVDPGRSFLCHLLLHAPAAARDLALAGRGVGGGSGAAPFSFLKFIKVDGVAARVRP